MGHSALPRPTCRTQRPNQPRLRLTVDEIARRRASDVADYRRWYGERWGGARGRVIGTCAIWPAADKATALAEMAPGIERFKRGTAAMQGRIDPNLTLEQVLVDNDMLFGHPEEIIDQLVESMPLDDLDELTIHPASSAFTVEQGLQKAADILDGFFPLLEARIAELRADRDDS